jgi:tetratricopeptide (TPR) repeat protein
VHAYGTAEVARLAGTSVGAVRAMVRARYVAPRKDQRGALRFSFQDLVVLRAARSLAKARVPARRIGDALRALRAQLPADAPLAGLTVTALGDEVVVRESGAAREARSGQFLLSFDVRLEDGKLTLIDATPRAAAEPDCERQFQQALALEETDVEAALEAYGRCIAAHGHIGAHTNRGRLLHEQGRLREAVDQYRQVEEPDAILLFNLAVALEDLGEMQPAIEAYGAALRLDPQFADAHFNLAQLLEREGEHQASLRHLSAYRRLTRE